MEEILIPMECLYDIPSLNQMAMPSYKAGDIFMFNPYHEVHVELDEHGVFKEVENNLCNFICEYPDLVINGSKYQLEDKIADKDIESLDEETLKSLIYIGYINKRLKENNSNANTKPKSIKKQKAKKSTAETYAMTARKLNMSSADFKKQCFDVLGIEIKDMRKKCPKKQMTKILKELGK